jgi:nicotinate phosphoribosyltransferase
VPIFASGDLDEYEILRLKDAGAVIDGYGIGTKLVTGTPVNGVYKLVEIAGIPVMKESSGKLTYPGRKQIFRRSDRGIVQGDRLGLVTESPHSDEIALMQPVFKQGERLAAPEPLAAIAERTAASVASLPVAVRHLQQPHPLQPELSLALQDLTTATLKQKSEKT